MCILYSANHLFKSFLKEVLYHHSLHQSKNNKYDASLIAQLSFYFNVIYDIYMIYTYIFMEHLLALSEVPVVVTAKFELFI